MSDDIRDISAPEAKAIIGAVKITMDAIEAGHLTIPRKDEFMALLKSSHAKLTNKDQGIIQRIN